MDFMVQELTICSFMSLTSRFSCVMSFFASLSFFCASFMYLRSFLTASRVVLRPCFFQVTQLAHTPR